MNTRTQNTKKRSISPLRATSVTPSIVMLLGLAQCFIISISGAAAAEASGGPGISYSARSPDNKGRPFDCGLVFLGKPRVYYPGDRIPKDLPAGAMTMGSLPGNSDPVLLAGLHYPLPAPNGTARSNGNFLRFIEQILTSPYYVDWDFNPALWRPQDLHAHSLQMFRFNGILSEGPNQRLRDIFAKSFERARLRISHSPFIIQDYGPSHQLKGWNVNPTQPRTATLEANELAALILEQEFSWVPQTAETSPTTAQHWKAADKALINAYSHFISSGPEIAQPQLFWVHATVAGYTALYDRLSREAYATRPNWGNEVRRRAIHWPSKPQEFEIQGELIDSLGALLAAYQSLYSTEVIGRMTARDAAAAAYFVRPWASLITETEPLDYWIPAETKTPGWKNRQKELVKLTTQYQAILNQLNEKLPK